MRPSTTRRQRLNKGTIRVVVWGAVLFLIVILSPVLFQKRPVTTEKGRRVHGSGAIHAPFCCAYVGLAENERTLFEDTFEEFAKQHDLRKAKNYLAYSGPPQAQFVNDRTAVYVRTRPTSVLVEWHDPHANFRDGADVGAAMWRHCFWPTNASRIRDNGTMIRAPVTGCIGVASYITNYPWAEFKSLADSLKASMQAAFPDRDIEVFLFDPSTAHFDRE